jgi:hypothetical protein
MQNWMINAVEQARSPNQNSHPERQNTTLVVNTLKERGIKRFIRQILSLSGKVVMKGKRILRIILNPLYPLISRIKTAF